MKLLLVCMLFIGVIFIIIGYYKQQNKPDIKFYKSILEDEVPQNKGLNLKKYYSSIFDEQTPWANYPINNVGDLKKWEGKVWSNSGWSFTEDTKLIEKQIQTYESDVLKLKEILKEAKAIEATKA